MASLGTVALAVSGITSWCVWPFFLEYTVEHATEPAFWWPSAFHAAYIEKLVRSLQAGMSEEQVRVTMKPVARDSGTVYWGGTGARTLYFAVGQGDQVWVSLGPGPDGAVVEVGPVEAKQAWVRYGGDSISVRLHDGSIVLH